MAVAPSGANMLSKRSGGMVGLIAILGAGVLALAWVKVRRKRKASEVRQTA
jgi:hypothetical protein